jgi:transcriptional regulator with XRE-family HTH domain
MSELADKIKEARKKMKLSLRELALNLDVTERTVWRWEHGISQPRYDTLIKIEKLLKIKL